MVSSNPTSTNLSRVDRLSTEPRDLGRHSDEIWFDPRTDIFRFCCVSWYPSDLVMNGTINGS